MRRGCKRRWSGRAVSGLTFRWWQQTGSTHDDLLAAARRGAAEGTVLVAEAQSAGRGRLGRSWVSPPRAGLTFSVLLRPVAVPHGQTRLGAVADRSRGDRCPACGGRRGRLAEVAQRRHRQRGEAGGILAEQAGDAIVVGAGINVSASRDELPAAETTPSGGPTTSLALEGATLTDRGQLLAFILASSSTGTCTWAAAYGDPAACGLRHQYQRLCATIGSRVRVQLPGGRIADRDGAGGRRRGSAGD